MQQEINNNFSKEDEFYMKRAIELAKRGTGWVNPNPLVGAVIVKDDRIIGEGWHRKYGELHAERDALSRCMEDTSGATIYVTLDKRKSRNNKQHGNSRLALKHLCRQE